MPVFEFICTDCGTPFKELVMNTSNISEVTCPACHGQNIFKKISIFASQSTNSGSLSFGSSSGSNCSSGSV